MAKISVALRCLLLLIFITSCFSLQSRKACAEILNWSRQQIPTNGIAGQWVLAEGSDLRCLTQAPDGTLYCYSNPSSTPYRLFKSTNGGKGWSYTGRVEDAIVDIAVLPDNSTTVYYTTSAKVFKSTDAGNSFKLLAANPFGYGKDNLEITCLDVASANGINYVAVGARDNDTSQFGGVFILNESQPAGWVDNGTETYDVYKVAFSPLFCEDLQLTAIGTDEVDTVVSNGAVGKNWGLEANKNRIIGLTPIAAAIAFPDDYDSNISSEKFIQFFSLNTGNGRGGVFRLNGRAASESSSVTKLDSGNLGPTDSTSLAVSGKANETKLLVGSATSNLTFFSADAGTSWSSSTKPPSGTSGTEVLMAADFPTGGPAFATTIGEESAFSISWNKGAAWSQTGLIDTRISTILDLAISPDYTRDSRLFLLTANLQNSVWYSSDGGSDWQRIFYTSPSRSDRINHILLSPQYGDNETLLLGGTSGSNPVFWKSEDNGRFFTQFSSVDPDTGAPVNIDTWEITSGNVLFVGSFDGDHGMVYQTAPYSLSYIDKSPAGNQVLNSLALSPNYNNDHTILVGNTSGSVYFSNDNGTVFEPLPFDTAEPPLSGTICLAFAGDYPQTQMVYAADDTVDRGIYRFVIGKSLSWESIDTSLPDKARIEEIVTSDDGVLYALNGQPVDNNRIKGGLERSLHSTVSTPVFETVTSGLEDGIILKKLWINSNRLWTIDATNNKLLTFADNLVYPITLTTPIAGATGQNIDNFTLSWEPVYGSTAYHWQINTADDFSLLTDKFEGDTGTSWVSFTLLNTNTAYYWRVRTVEPVFSPWSTVRSFDTLKISAPTLSQPTSTSTSSIEPIFKWSISEGADQYELLVSFDDKFMVLVFNRVCGINVWKSDIPLKYSTCYFWKVRAKRAETVSSWSAVSLFTTEAAPIPTPSPVLQSPKPSSPISSSSALINPIFKWSSVESADRYELVVSLNDDFSSLVFSEVCYSNVWICAAILTYNTSYYWKVRSACGEVKSDWSEVNAFTTRDGPSNSSSGGSGSSPLPASTTPSPSPAPAPTSVQTPSQNSTPSSSTASPSSLLTVSSTLPQNTHIPSLVITTPSPVITLPAQIPTSSTIPLVYLPPTAAMTTSLITTPSPLPASAETPFPADNKSKDPADSSNPLPFTLLGALLVLTPIMMGTIILLLKKGKWR